jgi:uncharacterized RDD family membrane protein YckC
MPFCSKCGASVPDGFGFCNACGQPLPASTAPTAPVIAPPPSYPGNAAPPAPGVPPQAHEMPPGCAVLQPRYLPTNVAFAGFWLRFVAWIIDAIFLGVLSGILLVPFGGFRLHHLLSGHPLSPEEFFGGGGVVHGWFVVQLLHWIYYALLESSIWQATLGKKALGLEVTDMYGQRVSFGRATGRFAARYLSIMTFGIGFILAGITAKKQALHDMIAGTLVIRKI